MRQNDTIFLTSLVDDAVIFKPLQTKFAQMDCIVSGVAQKCRRAARQPHVEKKSHIAQSAGNAIGAYILSSDAQAA